MKITFSVKKSYDHLTATITGRLTTAIEMLEMEQCLHSEQETTTVYQELCSNLYSAMEKEGIRLDVGIGYFKGATDVIFEYKIVFMEMKEPRPTKDISSEQIAGTVFLELFKHFGWIGWNAPDIAGEDYEVKDFKMLMAFKR